MNATCTLSKAGLPEAIRSIVAAIGNAFNMLPAPRRAIQRFGLGRSQSGPMQSARTKESKVWRARGAIFFVTRRCDINHATWALRFWQWRLWPSLEVCGVCDTIVAHMYGNSHWGRLFATVLRAGLGLLCLCACVPLFGRGAAVAAQGSFASASGFAPRFAIADFDGDRKPDLATIEFERDAALGTRYSIRLHLSAGDESAIGITGPQGGLQLEPRDVNGDDAIDLIVTTALDSHFVAVLLNDGHGKFTLARAGEFPDIENDQGVRLNAARERGEGYGTLQLTRGTFGIESLVACGAGPKRDARLLLVSLQHIILADFQRGKSGRSPPADVPYF